MRKASTCTLLIGLTGLLLTTGCRDESEQVTGPPGDVVFSETSEGSFFEVTGILPEDLPKEEEGVATASTSSVPAGATVLDFEDLDHTPSYHAMYWHNPYRGVTFSYGYRSGIYHYNNISYGHPHSGKMFIFNGYGWNGEFIVFDAPVIFHGAWVGKPHGEKQFWFEGYNGATKVGESAHITLTTTQQYLAANFGGPVDKVVFRRNCISAPCSWWVMDDITFTRTIFVDIDIKPGSDPNCIKDESKGSIPVAILSESPIDLADVDVSTVEIDDDQDFSTAGVAWVRWSLNKDVSGDGQPDLVMHFPTEDMNNAGLLGDGNTLYVTGKLNVGTPILGSDVIYLAGGPNCFD